MMVEQDVAMMPLAGIRVLDLGRHLAGPTCAQWLGDLGADVIKIENPEHGEDGRASGPPFFDANGPAPEGESAFFLSANRNKRSLALDLKRPEGQEIFQRLAQTADVVIENFRPGTLERWRLGPDELHAVNPRLVVARISGFGQTGPYASRPGFGTLAEAMSGFAALNGEPGSPPLLPPLALADGVTALATAFAVLAALRAREQTGRGQVVDVSLLEPLMTLLGPQLAQFDLLGEVQPRTGNRSSHNAPRNVYRTADDKWVAVSSSATSIAERVLRLVGRSDLVDEPWFATGAGRVAHVDEVDGAVADWIGARPRDEVIEAFERAEAAIAPVYDASDIVRDPHLRDTKAIVDVPDAELGNVLMTNVVARLSGTPGEIRWAGRPHGADTAEVLAELGVDEERLARLRGEGAV
jgi:crotonobetainyl-CoA:carnitine CoA-transferase CaiB-like acyl-CoA transferase